MALSEVSVCNRALAAIGTRSTIASLTESSVEARNCNLIYEDTRDELLAMANWNFAKKTAYLALQKSAPGTPSNTTSTDNQWSTDFPAPPWLYQYSYPSDCVAMRQIVQQIQNYYVGTPFISGGTSTYPYAVGPGAPFEVATDTDESGAQVNVVLTNEYQAIGVYNLRVTNPALFGSTFVEALVQALAAKLALALTGQVALANTKFAQANAIVIVARATDANEGLTVIDNMPDWITIREETPNFYGIDTGYTSPLGPLYGTI